MDSGAPSSIGGVISAAALCDAIGIKLALQAPKQHFVHGWGPKLRDAKPVICSWELPVPQVNGSLSPFLFHLVQGDDPLVIGEDVTNNAKVDNIANLLHLRQGDGSYCTFQTYLQKEEARRRLSVVPPPQDYSKKISPQLSSFLTSTARLLTRYGPRRLAHNLHRYSHAPVAEMKRICNMANILDKPLRNAIEEAHASCEICSRTGQPKSARKVSITHIGSAFNQSVQVDFFFPKIRGGTRAVLHMRDRATGYSEAEAVPTRDLDDAATCFDRTWISRHGAPVSVSRDPEFNRAPFRDLLDLHGVSFDARPARRHNKVGSVERKNSVIKLILQRLSMDCPGLTVSSLIARAVFLSNLFSGSRIASSFEQARGYTPGICSLPPSIVPPELIAAHREQIANRALHRLLSAKAPNALNAEALQHGMRIWAFLKSGDKGGEWESLIVNKPLPHYVVARRTPRGRTLHIAYEDIRIPPSHLFNKELISSELQSRLDTRKI